jgi:hypothetical protein
MIRAMFVWCLTITVSEIATEKSTSQKGSCAQKRMRSGMTAAEAVDPRET